MDKCYNMDKMDVKNEKMLFLNALIEKVEILSYGTEEQLV